jgi:hypothetical protein
VTRTTSSSGGWVCAVWAAEGLAGMAANTAARNNETRVGPNDDGQTELNAGRFGLEVSAGWGISQFGSDEEAPEQENAQDYDDGYYDYLDQAHS